MVTVKGREFGKSGKSNGDCFKWYEFDVGLRGVAGARPPGPIQWKILASRGMRLDRN